MNSTNRGPLRATPLPVVLAIDIEPDPRQVPVPCTAPWHGFELLLRPMAELRHLITQASGRPAHFSWFLRADPQIEIAYGSARWGIDYYRGVLDQLLASGDEIGIHPHSWRWNAEDRAWVSDQADSAWVGHCATVALRGYAEAFGQVCRVYRHGDRFWSEALWTLLAEAGVLVDLSPEPGTPACGGLASAERATGQIPYLPPQWHAPFRVGGDASALVTLPLTTVAASASHSETLATWLEPEQFERDLQARLSDPGLSHLAFAIRTDLTRLPIEWRRFVVNLRTLASLGDVAFVTASVAVDMARRRGGAAVASWPPDERRE